MIVLSTFFPVTALTFALVSAQSLVPIDTYVDYQCTKPSSSAENVSVPLDTCITTIGMVSFHMDALPCSGGSASSVQQWGFADAHCVKDFDYVKEGNGCYGAYNNNNAFGSIILTCTETDGVDPPKPQGNPTTINVGPVVTGAASTSVPSSAGSTSSSDSSDNCSGWNCLSHGARLGIIIGLSVGIPLLIISGIVHRFTRKDTVVYEQYRPPPPPVYKMTPGVMVERIA